MNFLMSNSGGRLRGLELMVTGLVIILVEKFIAPFTPFVFIVYGMYRLLVARNYLIGIASLSGGLLFWMFLMKTLQYMLGIAGVLMIMIGLYKVIKGKKSEDSS